MKYQDWKNECSTHRLYHSISIDQNRVPCFLLEMSCSAFSSSRDCNVLGVKCHIFIRLGEQNNIQEFVRWLCTVYIQHICIMFPQLQAFLCTRDWFLWKLLWKTFLFNTHYYYTVSGQTDFKYVFNSLLLTKTAFV